MAEYGELININDYLYKRPVYYSNPSANFKPSIVVKLTLNSNNFNFDLAKSDGTDLRIVDGRLGNYALKMWIAYWNKTNKYAVIFVNLVNIGSMSSVTLSAYWGNSSAIDISDPNSVDLIFSEKFKTSPLSNLKWSGDITDTVSTYGFRIPNDGFRTITNPLLGLSSWLVEVGLYADFNHSSVNAYTSRTMGIGFIGTENDFDINVLQEDRIRSNVVLPGGTTYTSYVKFSGGLEGYSYNELSISYDELVDAVTVTLTNRETFPDVKYIISRKVEGDTRPDNIIVYGREADSYNTGGYPTYVSWLAVRQVDEAYESALDGKDLFVPYENVVHENQDFKLYSGSICSLQYQHESSIGGNPYLLSNNGYDSDSNIWISDALATNNDYISLTINTAWGSDVTSRELTHYDSGHVYYYNASKLSDDDADVMSRSYWKCTTTSGWSAVKFQPPRVVNTVRLRTTTVSGANPMNCKFYGSNYNPVLHPEKFQLLSSFRLIQTNIWQPVILSNVNFYNYYILSVDNTYNNLPIELKEWEMMDYIIGSKKKHVSQLRLHPSLVDNYTDRFPKEVSLQGSNDGLTWSTIMPWRKTYTPFVKHVDINGYWQFYSFYNIIGYWSFRLLCRGNWGGSEGRISIGEWSLHELLTESYTSRIVKGTSNNFQQIWASKSCGLDDQSDIVFIANDSLSRISNNRVVDSEALPSGYTDLNIV